MKKEFREINDNKTKELMNSPDLKLFNDEIQYIIEQYLQGKLFFNQDKIEHFISMKRQLETFNSYLCIFNLSYDEATLNILLKTYFFYFWSNN